MKKINLAFIFSICCLMANARILYVATNGNDANNGSISAPFATLTKFTSVALAGDTCYVRGGVYTPTTQVIFQKSGTASAWIRIFNYPNETPIFDGANTNVRSFTHGFLKIHLANYLHVKGLEFRNTIKEEVGGIAILAANNILIERCVAHHNRAVGFTLFGSSQRPSANITYLNCDSYENDDWGGATPHEDADGFQITSQHVSNVKYTGCRAWNNGDDGYDFYFSPINQVTLERCWAFKNGFDVNGAPLANGNGFKLGGNTATTGGITLKNCAAWQQNAGFTWNGGQGAFTVYNCVAWSHIYGNFDFGGTAVNNLKNNIAFEGPNYISASTNQTFNSWTLPVTVTSADFAMLDDPAAKGPRQASGDLPVIQGLHLVSGSDLIDKGTNVGLPFTGSAPDLGAFEYTSSASSRMAPTANVAETTLGKFAAFPNPVNDVLTITLDEKVDQTRVSLFNSTGHLLLRKTINSQTTSIDFSNFKSGSYILKIEQNGKSFIQKIIK